MAGVRTTKDGVGANWRYTVGYEDGLNTPSSGSNMFGSLFYNPGLPPIIFLTGGGTKADTSPTGAGMTRILDKLNDSPAGYSIAQPSVRWALGGPGTTGSPAGTPGTGTATSPNYTLAITEDAIDNACAWMRTNLGCTNDPPIIIGVSNGWVCAIIYARDNPVSGIVGMLTVTAGKDGYDDAALQSSYGIHDRIKEAWNTNGVAYPTDGKYSPFDDIANYPDLRGKVQAWFSANDPLLAPQQSSFLQRPPIFAEMHNLGDYGHLGVLTISGELVTPDPVNHVDDTEVLRFIDDIVAGL